MPHIKEHYLRYDILRPVYDKDEGDGVTYNQLESIVIERFNKNLQCFPSDFGPRDLIEEYIKKGYIIEIKTDPRQHYPTYKVKNFWEKKE